jgi:hypothetical protein
MTDVLDIMRTPNKRRGRPPASQKVMRLDEEGDWLADYPSISHAADAVGTHEANIRRAIEQGSQWAGSFWDWRPR